MNTSFDVYRVKWKLSEPTLLASTFTDEVYRVKFNGHDAVLKVFNQRGKQFESTGSTVLR